MRLTSEKIVKQLVEMARATNNLQNPVHLTEKSITEIVHILDPRFNPLMKGLYGDALITDNEINRAIEELEESFNIEMDKGTILREDHYEKWYLNAQAQRGTKFWDRYETYLRLKQGLPDTVIEKISQSSDDIMDSLGDPEQNSDHQFQRKGLVIGAVQSGKTSNYIGLMNKAADSGYKVFIVLTGMVEKLRQQTQKRIDAGLVGADSKKIAAGQYTAKGNKWVGVGTIDSTLNFLSFTTTERDFSALSINVPLNSESDPIVFVVKKNQHILANLRRWIESQAVAKTNEKVDLPMLLIDDEADNASINTNKNRDQNPTAINHEIRQMLKLFTRYSYVGFTATPFANIFIDPQFDLVEKDAQPDDLFPKDFIYLLEQPSNYVGPADMYEDDDNIGKYHYMLRYNDDMEKLLPLRHKKTDMLSTLPSSLKNAIDLFILANAIRDVRGQETQHRSMLIHVSRFIDVQKEVKGRVSQYFKDCRMQIKHYSKITEESDYILHLHELFDFEYGNGPKPEYDNAHFEKCSTQIVETWDQVKSVLFKTVVPIQICTINSRGNGDQYLNYDEYPDGRRLIAVGGLSLSRGLTLEGLTISYFYRNTKMYDTLMQMGRWFGYRDGYADLCRLWTSRESADWYSQISRATEDLRIQIRQMAQLGKRPIEFGLRVRSSEETPLIVTARNKMSDTQEILMKRQLNGQVVETPIVYSAKNTIQLNNALIEKWLHNNQQYYWTENSKPEHKQKPTLKNVPKSQIVELLEQLIFPFVNTIYQDSAFIEEIKRRKAPLLDKWDVVVASKELRPGDSGTIDFGGFPIRPVERSFDIPDLQEKYIRFSGSKKRLANARYALAGLDSQQSINIEKLARQAINEHLNSEDKSKSPSQNSYFNTVVKRNPLLVIFPVRLKVGSNSKDSKEAQLVEELEQNKVLVSGISVGIPDLKGKEPMDYIYHVNVVTQRLIDEGSWETDVSEDENPDDIND